MNGNVSDVSIGLFKGDIIFSNQSVRGVFKSVLDCFLRGLVILAGSLVLVVFVAHGGLVPDGHGLSMFTFVQPLWSVPLVFLGYLSARRLGFAKIKTWLVVTCFINIVLFEDYNIASRERSKPTPLIFPTIKVMAWNVQYYDFGIEKVVAAIKAQNPDVVLLSEHILDFKQKKFYENLVKPYKVYAGPLGDTAVLTKLPVMEAEEVLLPSRQTNLVGANLLEEQVLNPRRSFMRVRVNLEGVPVDMISVRFIAGRARSESPLDAVPWGLYLWETQRREVDFFVEYIRKLGMGSYIFGGDLNAPPSSRSMRLVGEVGRDTYMDHHWYGHATFRSKIFRFQKKKNMPMIRLDYLFVSPEIETEKVHIEKINLSDHDALIGEYVVPRFLTPRNHKI